MSLMRNTADINKTTEKIYLVTLVRRSADRPMYMDHMLYKTAEEGQKFMARLVEAFAKAGYRDKKVDADHYQLDNGLDKINLTGKEHSVYNA